MRVDRLIELLKEMPQDYQILIDGSECWVTPIKVLRNDEVESVKVLTTSDLKGSDT